MERDWRRARPGVGGNSLLRVPLWRQCWIAGDPDETSLAAIIPIVGEDRFFWASDFPHPDHPPEYVPEVTRLTRELPESARKGFLGANVLRAFGIEK